MLLTDRLYAARYIVHNKYFAKLNRAVSVKPTAVSVNIVVQLWQAERRYPSPILSAEDSHYGIKRSCVSLQPYLVTLFRCIIGAYSGRVCMMENEYKSVLKILDIKLGEFNPLLEKKVFNNRHAYAYYFNKWHAETLYILINEFGEDSSERSRFQNAARMPDVTATDAQWSEYRKHAMLKSCSELSAIIATLPLRKTKKVEAQVLAVDEVHVGSYVDNARIQELRLIDSEIVDLSKLISICEELNKCYANDCFFAVAMLVRAIVDHVPPIFGATSFSEVISSYKGSRSFKESMNNLDKSLRKIADSHLHVQIRKSEVLPKKTQINFSPDLDVLLSEVVRILQK